MAGIACISRSLYRHKGGSWYSSDVYSRPVVTYLDQFNIERRLIIRLEDGTAIPRFEQLRAQISVMVAVGRLEPAQRLPTVRNLAQQLDLAPGTVARAYRELETDGLVEGRGRAGTFVVDEPPHSEPLRERRERIARLAVSFTFDARQVGATNDEALAAIAEALSIE
ncbi:MAG: GntR family transcriptional regulator [Actinobacteria bacterium]|jgi:GntR family transcriptional regulator|nr:GntR family transcriptional regulator [Actinomycetota bacterium]